MKKKGSRIEVMNGIAEMTGGGLKKKDLMYKDGKIISKKMNKKKIYKQRGGDDDCRDLAYGVYNALHEGDNLNHTNSNNDNKVLEYITKNKKFGDAVLTGNDIPDFIKYIAGEINTFNKNMNKTYRKIKVGTIINYNFISKYDIYNIIYSFLKNIKEKNTNFYIDYNDEIDNFIVTFEMIKSHKNTNKHEKLSLANIKQIERQRQGQRQGQGQQQGQREQQISFLVPNKTQNNRLGVAEQEETEIIRQRLARRKLS